MLRDLCFALETDPEETLELLISWAGLQSYFSRRINNEDSAPHARTFSMPILTQSVEVP